MSHSSDSFKGNCQILILVPRTQRHNPCLKRPQLIFPFCSWYSSFYITLPKKPNTAQWPSQKHEVFSGFCLCFCWVFICFGFFLFQDPEAVKGRHNLLKAAVGHTHALNSEVAHLDLCWGLSEVLSQSPEHQNKAEHLRTLRFLLLGSVSMLILSESQDKLYHRIIFYTELYKRFSQNSLAVFTPEEWTSLRRDKEAP